MPPEVIREHRRRGQDVADEDGPAGQLVENPAGHDDDGAEEEDLEGGEEDHQPEDQQGLTLGALDEQRADDAEGDEGHAVQHGVDEHGGVGVLAAEQG